MSRPVFIINFKNYPEALGEGALKLALDAQKVAAGLDIEVIVAPPVPSLAWIASEVSVPVFSQKVDRAEEGRSTGAVIPEALRSWGCAGSIINHSEARVSMEEAGELVARMRRTDLRSCVCAEDSGEVRVISAFGPEMIAVEPKDLIGTGVAVSKARPTLIRDSVEAARSAGFRGMLLCGAGIVSGEDVRAAMRLGADGVLVASAVVRAKDREAKLRELAQALS